MPKIYTKTGDAGDTGLLAGARVSKSHPRIAAYGDVDELNAVLGMVRSERPGPRLEEILERLQNELFALGAELAAEDPQAFGVQILQESHVQQMERDIDALEERLPPLKQFILPGGTKAAAGLHLARTVCRRAERQTVLLADQPETEISGGLLRYLNRLSDLLFVMARAANLDAGAEEIPWRKPEAAANRE